MTRILNPAVRTRDGKSYGLLLISVPFVRLGIEKNWRENSRGKLPDDLRRFLPDLEQLLDRSLPSPPLILEATAMIVIMGKAIV